MSLENIADIPRTAAAQSYNLILKGAVVGQQYWNAASDMSARGLLFAAGTMTGRQVAYRARALLTGDANTLEAQRDNNTNWLLGGIAGLVAVSYGPDVISSGVLDIVGDMGVSAALSATLFTGIKARKESLGPRGFGECFKEALPNYGKYGAMVGGGVYVGTQLLDLLFR